jgi:EAL domain-containing protein (putative c-di-GMP-specific phosphodiesterase class I)
VSGGTDPLGLRDDLSGAVAGGQIEAYYQPQIDPVTGAIVAVEALSRWRHPSRGLVLPDSFIPLAEEEGLVEGIDERMLEDACAWSETWWALGVRREVSVNVSAGTLATGRFFRHLAETVDASGLPAGLVTIEITESQGIPDLPLVIRNLLTVRERGVGVSLDDLGIGHSSVERMTRLPLTEVKLDQSLVQKVTSASTELIRAVVEHAEQRGLRVVAEGIQTEEQLDRIRELGCDRAQGFLIAPPMPREALDELLIAEAAAGAQRVG